MSKYMPQYRPGVYYNFSDEKGFIDEVPKATEKDAK